MKLFLAKNKQVRARGIKLKVEEYHIQGKGNASAFKMNNGDELGKVDGLNIIKNTLGKSSVLIPLSNMPHHCCDYGGDNNNNNNDDDDIDPDLDDEYTNTTSASCSVY